MSCGNRWFGAITPILAGEIEDPDAPRACIFCQGLRKTYQRVIMNGREVRGMFPCTECGGTGNLPLSRIGGIPSYDTSGTQRSRGEPVPSHLTPAPPMLDFNPDTRTLELPADPRRRYR